MSGTTDSTPVPVVVVTAAVIEHEGCFLLTRRLDGTHLAGTWEFPGGKCEPDESLEAALRRELKEELDVDAVVGEEVLRVRHAYARRIVQLHFFACDIGGAPLPMLGQEMQWVPRARLTELPFPEADARLVDLLAGANSTAPSQTSARPR
jgi:mutator protein MutT